MQIIICYTGCVKSQRLFSCKIYSLRGAFKKFWAWLSSDILLDYEMVQTLTIESCQCSVKILFHLLVYFMRYGLLHLGGSSVCLILTKSAVTQWMPVIEFLSRVSILLLTRNIDIAILSVRLSVCLSIRDTLVLYENSSTYRHSFFSPYGSPIIPLLRASNILTNFRRDHPLQGR